MLKNYLNEEKLNKLKDLNNINFDDTPDINEIKIDRRKSNEEKILDLLTQAEKICI